MNDYLICKMLLVMACIFSATVLSYNLVEGWGWMIFFGVVITISNIDGGTA